ncbi:exonuclease SbcC [Methylosinus sp. H3A]|uniref:putative immunity protein n=1 Tax=Methylosinus sp. H3A TaxID=2785786 RepID=UPI0018C34962|nr:exonuclease SbcC [Methylosinus sp. H3A]MBG0809590.1 exonuclease SbcC [Methylosinus sp. H3A]
MRPDSDRPAKADEIPLDLEELRAIAGFSAECAVTALEIFERSSPADSRPRNAIEAARTFARGGKRVKALRDAALAALKAALASDDPAASHAARAAMCASSAAYLHPLARSTQVRHILGAAAHAARAVELVAGDTVDLEADPMQHPARCATPQVVDVLRRFPAAPSGGGRVGELLRSLDRTLRAGDLTPSAS